MNFLFKNSSAITHHSPIKYLLYVFLTAMMLVCCTDLSDVESRLDILEQRVDGLESAVEALQKAYADGRIISDVSRSANGWTISFSDDSSIEVLNGVDGIDGKDGRDGIDGKDGRDGVDGKDGHDGVDGKDGRDGVDGKDGRDGVDGKDGRDGVDGKDGRDGDDGKDGADGRDGTTPYLQVDEEGYWCVSYDDKVTFMRLMDDHGAYVKAQGAVGAQGEQGEQGEQGIQGEEGVSLRVVVSDDGYYVIESYRTSQPDIVLNEVKTPYVASSAQIIQSIVEDPWSHTTVLTMADGTSYKFAHTYVTPTSIAVLAVRPLLLSEKGMAYVEFRVNPSSAMLMSELQTDDLTLELDRVSALTRSSYVTTPTDYRLADVEQVYDDNGIRREGQYRAWIEDLGKSSNYDDMVALVLTGKDLHGQQTQISSSAFEVRSCVAAILSFGFEESLNKGLIARDLSMTINGQEIQLLSPFIFDATSLIPTFEITGEAVYLGDRPILSGRSVVDFSKPLTLRVVSPSGEEVAYRVDLQSTGLPIVEIVTPDSATVTSKDEWMDGAQIRIYRADGSLDMEGTTSIKGRGNTNWTYPKKPYSLKFEEKSKVLGMPKDKRWVLLGNWMDRTLLRNDVCFEVSRRTGLDWTPRCESVELVMNGKHVGTYQICEKIKIDKNRVNINEMTEYDIMGNELTGGYLLEVDKQYDEVNKFYSDTYMMPYMIQEPGPSTLNGQQFSYIQRYINDMEASLSDYDRLLRHDYDFFLDAASFFDYWLVYEICDCLEPKNQRSFFMYKERGGLLKAGPVWDFDWGSFRPYTELYVKEGYYFTQLFLAPQFQALAKDRWLMLKPSLATIPDYITEVAERIRPSAQLNIAMWPIWLRVNGDETMTFDEAVERMRSSYIMRYHIIDEFIMGL